MVLIENAAAFRQCTVEKVPSADKDVVNKSYADGLLGVNLAAVEEDILPKIDDTYDLGSQAKRWSAIYAVVAVLTFATIGGIYIGATATNMLEFNASAVFNGSITARDNITASFYFGNVSLTTGLPKYAIHNSSANLTLKTNVYECFENCSAVYIVYNGTALRIKVT